VEQADEGEDDGSALSGGGEGVKLAKEASGEGNSGERDEEEDEHAAEQRRAIDEAAIVFHHGAVFVISAHERDHGEDADVHSDIGGDVKARCGDADGADAGEGGEQVAGMRDGGISQHALDVLLTQRGQVSHGHGDDGNDPQQRCPYRVQAREHLIDDAQEEGEGSGLGSGGEQRDDRRGRTFIDVRRPHVKRCGRDLEEDAYQHHGQRGENEGVIGSSGGEMRNFVNLRGAGGAEDKRNAIEKKCGGKGAQQEVFECGFGSAAALLAVSGQDVSRNRRNFKRYKDKQQFDGAGKQAHADRAEGDQGVELALMMAIFWQRIERDQQGYEHDAADDDVKKDGERARFDGSEKAGAFRQRKLPDAGIEGGGGSDGGEPPQ